MNRSRRSDSPRERNELRMDAAGSDVSADVPHTAARRRPLIRRAIVALAGATVLLATLTVPTAPAHAHVKEEMGRNCAGDQVKKCLWLNVDHHNERVRGSARVAVDDGPSYRVAVNNIRIEVRRGSTVSTVPASRWHDEDGWHWPTDMAATGLVPCIDQIDEDFRVRAHMRWRLPGSDEIIEGSYVSKWVSDSECFTS